MKAISRRTRVVTLVGLVLVAGAVAGYLSLQTWRTPDLTDVHTVASLAERHMTLPVDETPALVTVTDPSKLTTDFLKQTKVGDKVLIYQTHQRAIIYRPSIDRIIDVGPVVIDAVSK